MPEHDAATALLLDECIQSLLDGEDWRVVSYADPTGEMAPLVAIGHWLLQLARNVPPASHEGLSGIWRRVTESIDISRLAVMVLPAPASLSAEAVGVHAYR